MERFDDGKNQILILKVGELFQLSVISTCLE